MKVSSDIYTLTMVHVYTHTYTQSHHNTHYTHAIVINKIFKLRKNSKSVKREIK